uniref:Roadblock/LAMTOR2 domain-containing protein n=1 Tax=Ursus americanus TaxID=9643 RepID=A0A452SG67_URSAM
HPFPPPGWRRVEETLKPFLRQKGAGGIMMVNTESIPIKSSMDTTQHANLMHTFILKTWSAMREINPQNDLTFLQICSKRNEIMVAPDKDYFLIVIQNLTESILFTPCIIPLFNTPKNNNVNNVNQLADGHHLRAYLDQSSDQSHQRHPSAGQSPLSSWEGLLTSRFWSKSFEQPTPCFLPTFNSLCHPWKRLFFFD